MVSLPTRLVARIFNSPYARNSSGQAKAVTELFSRDENPPLPFKTAQLAASRPCEDAHRVVTLRDGGTLFAMLDGHAGVHAVHFAETTLVAQAVARIEAIRTSDTLHEEAQHLPEPIKCTLPAALTESFEATDSLFVEQTRSLGRPPKVVRTGACAMLVHVSQDQSVVHVANAGDCRCVVAREMKDGKLEWVALSTDHNALSNEKEAALLRESHPGEERLLVRGYVKGRVQMTRSIGDLYLKHADFNTSSLGKTRVASPYNPPYLSCTPEVKVHAVDARDKFMVIATDGLWSELTNDEVLLVAQRAMDQNNCPARELAARALNEAALQEGLPVEALLRIPTGQIRKRIHDDITVTVVFLNSKPALKTEHEHMLVVKGAGRKGTVVIGDDDTEVEVPESWVPAGISAGDRLEIVKH